MDIAKAVDQTNLLLDLYYELRGEQGSSINQNPVYKAYEILVDARDNGTDFDMDEVIGYLGEALDE